MNNDFLTLENLIEMLDAATTGSAELDLKVQMYREGWKNVGGGWREYKDARGRERWDYITPSTPYTTSIEQALKLVYGPIRLEKMGQFETEWYAVIYDRDLPPAQWPAKNKTAALAVALAAFKAELARQQKVNGQ